LLFYLALLVSFFLFLTFSYFQNKCLSESLIVPSQSPSSSSSSSLSTFSTSLSSPGCNNYFFDDYNTLKNENNMLSELLVNSKITIDVLKDGFFISFCITIIIA
jgi:hypothetical protein